MSFLLVSASRTFQSSFSRPSFLLRTSRVLSTQTNPNIHQTQSQQTQGDYPSSSPRRRYRYYFLSIAAGVLIGAAYTFRQSRKYEGLMPEYISNAEPLERKAMETRPVPPPVTKHITFDDPPREKFPFKLTLYQYVTWFVFLLTNHLFIRFLLVHFVVKFVPISITIVYPMI